MPDPNIPTTETIRDRIVSDVETSLSQTVPLFQKAFVRVLASAIAGSFTILFKHIQWALDQRFTITQDEDTLELKGDQYNIVRKQAVAAQVTVSFTGTNGTLIPVGTQFRGQANGLVYSVDTLLSVALGVASGDMTCLTSGSDGNLTNGSVLTILSPIYGLDNDAAVTATVIEGEDQENLDDYRARIQEREKRPPQGGSTIDYIIWAKEVADVTRAFAWGKRDVSTIAAGYVLVYPLTDNDSAGRIPSSSKLTEIKDYIDDPSRAPLQAVAIQVLAMAEREFTIDVTALSPNTAEVRNEFETNLTAYLLEREPQQFTDQIDVKDTISRSGVEAIAINSGADSITLDLYIDGTATPIEDHTLLYYELAKLDTVTFP